MFITRGINEKLVMLAYGVLCCAALSGPARAQDANAPAVCRPGQTVEIAVESADIHLEIRLADGRKLLLRGIEPPRGTPSIARLAEEARAYLNGLIAGRKLQAEIESEARDRWGRYPATIIDAGGRAIAELLLGNGWARVDAGSAGAGCLAALLQRDAEARAGKQGIWADPAYAVLKSGDRDALAQRAGEIVLVEGQVTSVGQWRTLTFLNLGKDRRADPAVVLSRRLVAALEKEGRSASGLTGATIRVRGQLQMRTSPRIEIFSPGALEVLSAVAKSAEPRPGTARRRAN